MRLGRPTRDDSWFRKGWFLVGLTLATLVLAALAGFSPGSESSSEPKAVQRLHVRVAHPSPATARPDGKLAKGKFLIAGEKLRDPNFARTVVLLIEYGQQGAMGLIINRATDVRLSKLLPQVSGLQQRGDTVYIGGPVARGGMLLLIHSGNELQESQRVLGEVYLSSSRDVLEKLTSGAALKARFRAYAGHAGWAPGQLDAEVARGDWHLLPADQDTVFDPDPSGVWRKLIRRSIIRFASTPIPRTASQVSG